MSEAWQVRIEGLSRQDALDIEADLDAVVLNPSEFRDFGGNRSRIKLLVECFAYRLAAGRLRRDERAGLNSVLEECRTWLDSEETSELDHIPQSSDDTEWRVLFPGLTREGALSLERTLTDRINGAITLVDPATALMLSGDRWSNEFLVKCLQLALAKDILSKAMADEAETLLSHTQAWLLTNS